MVLPEPVKARARVHMGVPVLGVQDSGFALGFRFTNVMGLLEYRMNNLQPWEYAHLTGYPAGSLALMGTPSAGNTLSATVGTTGQVTYTVTNEDATAADPMFSVAYNFCAQFNA